LTNPTQRPDKPFIYVDVSSVSNTAFRIVETNEILGRDAPSRARKLIKMGDVLFATVRPTLRRIALVPPELDNQVCSTGYCVVRTDPKHLLPEYAYFFLLTEEVAARVESMQKGATYPAISDGDLLGLQIPLPPLPEQRAITRVLRAVQAAREARQREAALERECKAALMDYLFTHGTRGEPTKQTPIGEMPESWEVVRVGDMFHIQLGKMLSEVSKKRVSYRPYLRNANVQWGRVDLTDLAEMDFNERERERFRLHKGDILVCEGGEIGRTAIWNGEIDECYFQKAIHRLRAKDLSVSHEYFQLYMTLIFIVRPVQIVEGARSTIAHLPVAKLSMVPLAFPSREEQDHIVDITAACDAKIAALDRERALLDELFRALLEELMCGRVRVA